MVAIATPLGYQRGHEICNLWPLIAKTQRSINFKLGRYTQQVILVT